MELIQTSSCDSRLSQLPPEILLDVLSYLDVNEILCLRRTAKHFNDITRERPTWIHLLQIYQAFLPIPQDVYRMYHTHDTSLLLYSSSALENIVRYAKWTRDIWTRPREPPFRLHTVPSTTSQGWPLVMHVPRKGNILLGMQLFLDRWLVVVYADGVANLYDVSDGNATQVVTGGVGYSGKESDASSARRTTLRTQLDREPWNSFATAYDEHSARILLVVARQAHVNVIEIYAVSLHSLDQSYQAESFIPDLFQQVGYKTLSGQRSVRHVDPRKRVIILSSSNKIEVFQWHDRADGNRAGYNMELTPVQKSDHMEPQILPEDLEELWNGILGVRLLGDHVLVFRTRSLEVYHYDFTQGNPTNVDKQSDSAPGGTMHIQLKHTFSLTFRDVTFSDVATSRSTITSRMQSYELKLLAYDVIQGLFQYIVKLSVPIPNIVLSEHNPNPASVPLEPTLEVKLLGVYPLSFGGAFKPSKRGKKRALIASFSSALSSGTTTPTPMMTHSHSLFQAPSAAFGSRGANGNARGFISAHCMGPQGKRAVWVERKRSSTVREVQVWAMEPPAPFNESDVDEASDKQSSSDGSDLLNDDDLPMEFENQVVYAANSYDLRDDIVLCTFSELHGTIVLGHRSGEVSVLDL
ncbi:hypothetical protein CVT24_013387 [Panaeolus cyanescens]|uniref:F-box domain-containing protein n=1 Tax=Panaeolus cyanescens TaxID=181874 RepID=A0A409YNX6_9AGAR|nr:hypothetical protein CVT24_013387 [Panaeolus cyanescens]